MKNVVQSDFKGRGVSRWRPLTLCPLWTGAGPHALLVTVGIYAPADPSPLWLFLLKIQSWLTTISSFVAKVSALTSDPFRLLEMCLETEGRAGLSCSFYVEQVYLCQTQAESRVPLKMTYVHICGFGAHIFKC